MTTPAPTDLTTLANLKAYMVNAGNAADATLQRMLSAASVAIENYLDRDIVPTSYAKTFDGNNGRVLVLPDYPVLAISSLTIDGSTIAVGSTTKSGYFNNDKQVVLNGYRFTEGKSNVVVNYSSGYQITGEAWTVPATPFQVTAKAPKGAWLTDQGVAYATSGLPLTVVPSSPTIGQYSVSIAGVYTFALADVGAGVLLNYGYAPFDLEQVCMGLVQYWLGDRNRNGEVSRSMGGQTITFSQTDMPNWCKTALNQYRRVFMA